MLGCQFGRHKYTLTQDLVGTVAIVLCTMCGRQVRPRRASGITTLIRESQRSDERPLVHLNADDL
jgi:hypothetical protein